jgi:hypothetical protein
MIVIYSLICVSRTYTEGYLYILSTTEASARKQDDASKPPYLSAGIQSDNPNNLIAHKFSFHEVRDRLWVFEVTINRCAWRKMFT